MGITKTTDINVTPREIDFVTRFERNWEHLRDIIGIMKPIKKQPGAVLKSKKVVGRLADGEVAEGEAIPYSSFEIDEFDYAEMAVEKYKKGVTIEAIKEYGYDTAVQKTDDEFLYQLQQNVTDRFYTYLKTGELTATFANYQAGLAMAKGLVENKFKKMHRNITGVVGFINVLDVYQYLSSANITVQTQFGFQYIKDFLGYNTLFLLSDEEIPQGKIIVTPVENIVMYYVDPGESDFARAGLNYVTSGETNLIGFHTQGNYDKAVSDSYAILGLVLFAEYIDAVAVVTVSGITPITSTKYFESDLMEMTKAEIQTLATQKGYTITGTTKQELIESFLEAQADA